MLTLEQCLRVTDLGNNSVNAWAALRGTESDDRVGVKDCWNGSEVTSLPRELEVTELVSGMVCLICGIAVLCHPAENSHTAFDLRWML